MTVGIASATYLFPPHKKSLTDVFQIENLDLSPEISNNLRVGTVSVCEKESGSELALRAAQQALDLAEILPSQIGVIVDYSIMPQDYLVPAWNMSNKLQYELDAAKAFTLGFSAGGATNFLVALNFATALLKSEPDIHTALLVAADIAIPGNRILNPENPITVLGDGASAVVLRKDSHENHIIQTALKTDGYFHDVCYIPGGALAHLSQPAPYRMVIDEAKYQHTSRFDMLQQQTKEVLSRAGLDPARIISYVYPNLSAADRNAFRTSFLTDDKVLAAGPNHGHIQGTDLVINLSAVLAGKSLQKGDFMLLLSHGMGFMSGVTLIRH